MLPNPVQPCPDPLAAKHKATRRVWLVAMVLVLATLAAYCRTFSVPFVFDDLASIPLNPSIRQFDTALFPPNTNGETVSGRPLLNLSLALNYAIDGTRVRGYHALNLLIHACAGLALFGLVRRTFLLPSLRDRFGDQALPLAATIAALWLLHPLQTESVTYIVQRAESLMTLCYLGTLYCFARHVAQAAEPAREIHSRRKTARFTNPLTIPRHACWLAASALCCLLGMASKEVMVSAPLIVLLYDRAFASGTFRAAWDNHRVYYASLAATWLLFAWLAINTGNRGSTAGFGLDISPCAYLLTQAKAIPRYLRLALWPSGLTFDYGTATINTLTAVWPQALLMLALLAATIRANIRHPKIGLPLALFFAALAPSSSFVPVTTQTMAEHRMYLPLAAVIALTVIAIHALAQWRGSALPHSALRNPHSAFLLPPAIALPLLLATLTYTRNLAYLTPLSLWQDTVAKAPDNPRAHNNISAAHILADTPGDYALAIAHAQTAIRLDPASFQACNNLGFAQYKLGNYDDALANYNKALQAGGPGIEIAYHNRGTLYYELGRYAEAVNDLQTAIKLQPLYTEAYCNLSNPLFALRRTDEALRAIDTALAQDPDSAASWNNRGNILAGLALDNAEALRCYQRADQLAPGKWEYLDNIARFLVHLNRPAESLPCWQKTLPLAPDKYKAHFGYGNALMLSGRVQESIPQYEAAIASNPRMSGAQMNLAIALTQTGRPADALPWFESALRINPNDAPAHHACATALAALGRHDEALARTRQALFLNPNFAPAREQLEKLQHVPENACLPAAPPLPSPGTPPNTHPQGIERN